MCTHCNSPQIKALEEEIQVYLELNDTGEEELANRVIQNKVAAF